jgi:hypothetical protein
MEAGVIWAIAKVEFSHQNLKKLMNSYLLSFFISKVPCKAKVSIYATYQFSFSPFTKCASSLHWSKHVYWISAPQLPLSFPFHSVSFHTCCSMSNGDEAGSIT